jgi:rare lipoprotein A
LNSLTKALLFSLLLVLAGAGTLTQILPAKEEPRLEVEKSIVNDAAKPDTSVIKFVELGDMRVSWYGHQFQGNNTASGESYDQESFTAAHRNFRFGTLLRLTNPETDRSVIVRVNDRGPFVRTRALDVSKAAARELGFLKRGVTTLKVEQMTLQGINFPVIQFN